MTDITIWATSVLAIAGGLWIYQRRLHGRFADNVYTSKKSDAHYGVGFGPVDDGLSVAIRQRIFERDGGRCKITGESGIQGQPNNRLEYFKIAIGKDELEVGHVIPWKLGGPTEDWNLLLMKKEINRRLSNKVTPRAEALCRKRGEKIYSVGIRRV